MAERCRDDSENNPGLQLGAVLGASAVAGRDKVTLVTSPGLERFGLWAEQLLAESTGKNGKGLIPVANEPLCDPGHYGNDRNFIYLRLEDADNRETDRFATAMERHGHPVTTLQMTSLYDIGAEFFRWEFATAVAGHVVGIFPFDQPDVNAAKDRAREILGSGTLAASGPSLTPAEALTELLKAPETGDYVAIGAFVPESAQLSAAFAGLRAAITHSTGMATTFGYGPRYQHSIGQLYKGGPDSIRFLGLISHGSGDLQVPGEQYTLGALTPAQAYGDFEVMRDTGRRIQTGVLGKNPVAEIKALAADLNEA
jgi:glucose-6-phosphate isomerase/transaldolase/glucose-6-phosphate isomerase